MSVEDEITAQVNTWRKMEDKYYASVLNVPEFYMAGIRLVRAVVDCLKDVTSPAALLDTYRRTGVDLVAEVADGLDVPQLAFLNYDLARDTAFYLRYQEIMEAQAEVEVKARIATARAEGAEWAVLYDNETSRHGHSFFQRLEIHLPDGLGLYTAVELDWEKGRLYVLEPLALDPDTGQPRRGVAPPDSRQEFTTRAELAAAVAVLREKYSKAG
ncbi:MAG: hypothetical protein KJ077_23800 [Anaerolineae bacterium]|nr:hypothetical protein [Anaerolineae bacterium]